MKGYAIDNHSEIVSKQIIEKLITNVLIDHNNKTLDSKIAPFCFEFVKEKISPYLQEFFINNEDKENDHNTWIEIEEPKMQNKDRGTFTLTKIEKKQNEKDPKENEESMHEVPSEQKTMSRDFYRKTGFKLTLRMSKKLSMSHMELTTKEEEKKEKQRINELVSSFPSYAIERRLGLPLEPEFIPKIRNEYQKELVQRDLKLQKERKLNLIKSGSTGDLITKKVMLREFNNERYTFDSNGNVIPYRFIRVDNMKNDFHSPDVNEKVIKNIIRQDEFKKQDTTTTSNKKKGKNFLDILPSEFRENTNIYRLVMNSMKGRNSLSIGCPPSGDNVSLIQPEIGVVIKNDQLNKAKDGGRNFREKFKRFSLNDYDKLIKTILPFQNQQKVEYSNNTNNISNSSSNTNMFMNNSNLFQSKVSSIENMTTNFIEPSNPSKLKHSVSMSTMKINPSSVRSNLKIFLDTMDELPEIKMNNPRAQNLFSSFDVPPSTKKESILTRIKMNHSTRNKTLDLEQVNMFNINLIKSKKEWGSPSNKGMTTSSTFKTPIKPNFSKIIKRNGITIKQSQPYRVKQM